MSRLNHVRKDSPFVAPQNWSQCSEQTTTEVHPQPPGQIPSVIIHIRFMVKTLRVFTSPTSATFSSHQIFLFRLYHFNSICQRVKITKLLIKQFLPSTHFLLSIYIQSNEIHNVVTLIKFLLVLRCQLYMFRTVTVHPQELLCRYCMCRLWYVL